MKTSEFITKFNGILNNLRASRGDGGIFLDGDDGHEYVIEKYQMAPIGRASSLDIDQLSLIMEYIATPIEKREPERKWVVPFGRDQSDDYQHFWAKVTGRFDLSGTDDINWNYRIDVQFTDSELEKLKQSQSSAIAQAIDSMKEPAPEVEE